MLHLTARAVARANIENIDRLGAFNGAGYCLYHYDDRIFPPYTDCAIGIVDVDRHLVSEASLRMLKRRQLVDHSDEDAPVLTFIQHLHDRIVFLGRGQGSVNGDMLREHFFVEIPPCCADLVATITEINKDTYRQIMQRIAES